MESDEIVYRETGGVEVWRIPVEDVLLVAENTTAIGDTDDYFLQFGTISEGEPCLTACAVPSDVRAFLEELGARLGKPLKLKLGKTTTLASRVMWPDALSGRPLFVQRETALHEGMAKLRRRLFGGLTEWVVSAEVFDAMSRRA